MTTLGEVDKACLIWEKRGGMDEGVAKSARKLRVPVDGSMAPVPLREAVAMR